MLADGFLVTDAEYIAAQLYFSQSPAPQYVWVGMIDPTAIKTVAVDAGNEGTGYQVGDVLALNGGAGGTVSVTGINAGTGAVTAVSLVSPGTGYSVADETTTGGHGTGCKVNVTAVGDTCLSALQTCRAMIPDWYTCMVTTAVKADHEAIAAWIETATPTSIYGFTTADSDVLGGVAGNIFDYLKSHGYSRTIGQYSTTAQAIAAILGYAMGQNLQLVNSAFTLKFKQEVGVTAEALNSTQISYIEGVNGNVYLNYANYYNIFEQGVMANGQFFDEIINLDMLHNGIQLNVMDLLYGNPKVPITDSGVTQIIHAINQACDDAVNRGFLGPGQWTGAPLLNLNTGDTLPNGYLTQAAPVSSQSSADRAARKCPPIYVAIKEAGAVHSLTIGVYVNR
jgi:hypothetical protein